MYLNVHVAVKYSLSVPVTSNDRVVNSAGNNPLNTTIGGEGDGTGLGKKANKGGYFDNLIKENTAAGANT